MINRWFRLDHDDDDGPAGLVATTSSQSEIEKMVQAFQQQNIELVEVDAAEARRIRRQQNAADNAAEEE